MSSYDVEMANTIALKNPTYYQQVNEQQQQKISNHHQQQLQQQQQQVAIKKGGNLDVGSSSGGDFKLNHSTSSAAETNGSTAVINPMVPGGQSLVSVFICDSFLILERER